MKTRTAIAGGQWVITIQLEVGEPDPKGKEETEGTGGKFKPHEPGKPIGEPVRLVYADSYLAKCPSNVGTLIGGRIEELALRLKPQVKKEHRTDLTLGQRAADVVRNGMGSWPFVFGFMFAMILWGVANTVVLHGGFDPYPYILLNLMLSTLAGLQGAILLIAAKRADKISGDLAEHDFETNLQAKEIIDAVHALTLEIHNHTVPK